MMSSPAEGRREAGTSSATLPDYYSVGKLDSAARDFEKAISIIRQSVSGKRNCPRYILKTTK